MIRSDKNSTITLMKYVAMSEVAKLTIALTILLKLYLKSPALQASYTPSLSGEMTESFNDKREQE
jgi:hypothetical protein